MSKLLGTIRKYSKKIALFCGLFLLIFVAFFFIANLDLSPAKKAADPQAGLVKPDMSKELAAKLGSTGVYMESYADWAKRYGLDSSNNGYDQDPDHDGLPNYLEYVYGTNPLKADTDGDGYSDKQEIMAGYDPNDPGSDSRIAVEVIIPKINVDAPMVWSKSHDDNAMLADLENGLSHYVNTAAPGQNGNMIISGHSSNYIWAKGNYNHVFKDLNDLNKGDIVKVKTVQADGRVIIYQYAVTGKYIDAPDDPRIFADSSDPTLTLSTCWPLGTNLKRLIVKAEIVH